MAQSFAYSDPNLKSKEDWLAFVDEVDKHLKRYAIGGIFPEQYEGCFSLTSLSWYGLTSLKTTSPELLIL